MIKFFISEDESSLVATALVKNDFNEKIDNSNSDYARKLGVIQHSIYGVDIQPIAAEISKLRSFLSLIIDENIDDNAPNRGIEPLPNLEFKFVTANTLISLDEGKKGGMMTFDFGETTELQNQLQQLRNTYLQASPQEKENLKQELLMFEEKNKSFFSKEEYKKIREIKETYFLNIIDYLEFVNPENINLIKYRFPSKDNAITKNTLTAFEKSNSPILNKIKETVKYSVSK